MGNTNKFCRENINALEPYIPGYQPVPGHSMIKLNANENPYPPAPRVLEQLKFHISPDLRLYPNSGSIMLRQKIAAVYGIDEKQIFCANGSDEIISLIFRTFAGQEDRILFPYPTYTFYKTAAQIHGVDYRFIDSDDNFSIRLPDFLTEKSKIIFLANPNAHTGILLSLPEIEYFLASYSGLLVIDEAYIDFAGSDTSAYNLTRTHENLLVLRTFSKSFSLCGIRVGYAFGHPELISAMDKTKDSYNIAYLNQIAAISALEDYDYMVNNAQKIITTREWFKDSLIKLGFIVLPSSGNFVFIRHSKIDARDIYEGLLVQNILARFFNERRMDKFVRISVGLRADMEKVILILNKIIMGKGN